MRTIFAFLIGLLLVSGAFAQSTKQVLTDVVVDKTLKIRSTDTVLVISGYHAIDGDSVAYVIETSRDSLLVHTKIEYITPGQKSQTMAWADLPTLLNTTITQKAVFGNALAAKKTSHALARVHVRVMPRWSETTIQNLQVRVYTYRLFKNR